MRKLSSSLLLKFHGFIEYFGKTRFQLILPVANHNVTKNLTGHRLHVAGPRYTKLTVRPIHTPIECKKISEGCVIFTLSPLSPPSAPVTMPLHPVTPRYTLLDPRCTLSHPLYTLLHQCYILLHPCYNLLDPIAPLYTLLHPHKTLSQAILKHPRTPSYTQFKPPLHPVNTCYSPVALCVTPLTTCYVTLCYILLHPVTPCYTPVTPSYIPDI